MYIALDLETTGLQARKDKIIEFAAMKMKPDGTILEELHFVIDPGIPIPQIITHITGITNEEIKGKPTLDELKPQIIEFIGNYPILGHSIQFDIDFLNANGIAEEATPLDTFQLAQTLLPNEESYSLEILSEKYQLPHPNKHRADDDTRVAIELYKLLLQKIKETPEHHIKPLQELLSKSEWSWKDTFLSVLGESPTPTKTTTSSTPTFSAPLSEKLQQQLFENLTTGKSSLIECPDYTPLDITLTATHMAEQTGEHVVIVTPRPEQFPTDTAIAHLENPRRTFNQTYFKKFLTQTAFTDKETRMAIKIMLWLDHTKTGLKSELSIGNDEQITWESVSEAQNLANPAAPDPDSFYGKAFKNAKYTPVLVVHPSVMLENIVRKATILPEKAHLIIDQIEELEEATLHSFTNQFSLDQFASSLPDPLKNSFGILFGMLGLLLEKFYEDDSGNKYPGSQQLILEPQHLHSNEGSKIKDLLTSISGSIDQTSPFTQNQFRALKKAFNLTPGVMTWINIDAYENVILRACPESPKDLLLKHLWGKFKTLNGLTHFGTVNGSFSFLKRRLELPSELEKIHLSAQTPPIPLPLFFYPYLPNVKVPANNTETAQIIRRLLAQHETESSVFLLTNSIKAAEQLHSLIEPHVDKEKWNLFAQGVSGGIGKIKLRFENNSIKTLIIGNSRLYKTILTSSKGTEIDTLLIHRIPFRFPWHPVLKNDCDLMKNNFTEYTIPTAILALKQYLHSFKTQTSPLEVHMLDPRIEQYSGALMSAFSKRVQIMN
jgi:DNA polymerase III epsilon subunit family exonuclease